MKRILSILFICSLLVGCTTIKNKVVLEEIPEYSGEPFIGINDYVPFFSEEEKKSTESFESYSELDELGRCGVAYANIGPDLLPTEERENISEIKPTGWHSYNFEDTVDNGYLYNRCHLIAYCLSGENANEKNLITGTRYMNIYGMSAFENSVKAYVEETGNHVLYRVTPFFEGNNLLCTGVEMEAWSVEDDGVICFNVFCYNVQPKVTIDYKTGEAKEDYSNVLYKPEIKETMVFNSKNENIGKRAYMNLREETFNSVSDTELKEFCEDIIKEYEKKEYNYFTIDFGNGKGAVFPACTYNPIEVGQINDKGEILQIESYIYVTDTIEKYSKSQEELIKENEEKSKVQTSKEQRIVYVSTTGKYHSKTNCSGMKNYTTMTYDEAIAYGYEACKKCN